MRTLLKDFTKDFMYTWTHKKAFLITEKELTGKNTLAGYLHDVDKLFLYIFFTKKETSKIHRAYARHHMENVVNTYDKIQMLVDWESNRKTKSDKQESALQYMEMVHPDKLSEYSGLFERLGLS